MELKVENTEGLLGSMIFENLIQYLMLKHFQIMDKALTYSSISYNSIVGEY
jgi:hypothetical protein